MNSKKEELPEQVELRQEQNILNNIVEQDLLMNQTISQTLMGFVQQCLDEILIAGTNYDAKGKLKEEGSLLLNLIKFIKRKLWRVV